MTAKEGPTMPTADTTTSKLETWADWMPAVPPTMTAAQFVGFTNARFATGATITVNDLEAWQDDGMLPAAPLGYPPLAWQLIRDLLDDEREGTDPELIRGMLRSMAGSINRSAERTAKNATWRDWMPAGAPEPDLLSHDELVHELHQREIDVTPATLEHWRRNGVIPRPIRRRHQGNTRPVYPGWLVDAIVQLRELQDAGRSLEQIAPIMRARALSTVSWRDPLSDAIAEARAALTKLATAEEPNAATVKITYLDSNGNPLPAYHEFPVSP